MLTEFKKLRDRSTEYFLLFAAFFLPLFPPAAIVLTGMAGITWLIRDYPLVSLSWIRANKSAVALIAFFLIYLAGVSISSDTHYAWKDVLSKIPFLIVPLLFNGTASLGGKRN